jgi:glycosyltransferase involved in cell wall biosynthesis
VKYSIGISTYNDGKVIGYLLDSLCRFTPKLSEIGVVVIDDGSTNQEKLNELRETIKYYKARIPTLEYVEHEYNFGIPVTWNDLTRYYDSEYVILFNNDIIVAPNWFESISYFLENNKNFWSVSLPMYYIQPEMAKVCAERPGDRDIICINPTTKQPEKCLPHNYNDIETGRPARVMAALGCLFGFRRDHFEELKWIKDGKECFGWDENIESFCEEVHAGTYQAMKGRSSYALPWPYCFHIWSYTFSKNSELDPQRRKKESDDYYRNYWQGYFSPDTPPEQNTHIRYMGMAPQTIKWLDSEGVHEYNETDEDVRVARYGK